jgi:hypothetical protein
MNTTLFFLISLVAIQPSLCFADKSEKEQWLIDGKNVEFFNFEKDRIRTSKDCGQDVKKLKCIAIDKLTSKKSMGQDVKFSDQNPGALICEHLEGKVVIGTDSSRNQNSFCKFNDNSMIDNGSLTYQFIVRAHKHHDD